MREGPELLDFGVDEVAEQLTLLDAVSTGAGRGCGADSVEHNPTHLPTLPTSLHPGALFTRAALRVPGLRVVTAGPSGGHERCPHGARHRDPVQHGDRLRAGLRAGRAGPGSPTEGAAAGEVDPRRPGAPRRGRGRGGGAWGWGRGLVRGRGQEVEGRRQGSGNEGRIGVRRCP